MCVKCVCSPGSFGDRCFFSSHDSTSKLLMIQRVFRFCGPRWAGPKPHVRSGASGAVTLPVVVEETPPQNNILHKADFPVHAHSGTASSCIRKVSK